MAETQSENDDMVPYAWAHNEHWAFINRYKGTSYSFNIIKDYNCETFVSFDLSDAIRNNNPTIADQIDSELPLRLGAAGYGNDIWLSAKLMVETSEDLRTKEVTFSGIAYRNTASTFAARFCMGGSDKSFWTFYTGVAGDFSYNALLYTTRQGNYRTSNYRV